MPVNESLLSILVMFKKRAKFSDEAWASRGLIPSSKELCDELSEFFDICVDAIIAAIEEGASSKKLKTILKSSLSRLNEHEHDYDSEEQDFIGDLLIELAQIIQVNIGKEVSAWRYGPAMNELLNIPKGTKAEDLIEIISQPCSKCNYPLEMKVLNIKSHISFWDIVKCTNCQEINLLLNKPDIQMIGYSNCEQIEMLNRLDYSKEQALSRVEQLKLSNEGRP